MSPDGKTIEFSFLDVAGSTKGGLLKRMMFTMVDANKHVVDFTFIMQTASRLSCTENFSGQNEWR